MGVTIACYIFNHSQENSIQDEKRQGSVFHVRNVQWNGPEKADNTSFTCPDEDGAFGHCCLPAECPSGASPADCESQSTNGRRKSVAYVTAGLKKVGRYGRHGGVGDWWHCYFTYIGSSNIVYDILDPFLRIGWIDNIYTSIYWVLEVHLVGVDSWIARACVISEQNRPLRRHQVPWFEWKLGCWLQDRFYHMERTKNLLYRSWYACSW